VLKEEHIGLIIIDHFKLVFLVKLVVNMMVHVYVYVQTKEQNCLKELCKEKD
jgi:hypothetical protein